MEVLEEDLRTGSSRGSSLSSPRPPQSLNWSPVGTAGYNSEEFDEMIPSPVSYLTCSPGAAEYQQVLSPPASMDSGPHVCSANLGAGGQRQVWAEPPSPDWKVNSSCFFWAQLQKEELVLRGIADTALLHTDGRGRTCVQLSSASGS